MVKVFSSGAFLINGTEIVKDDAEVGKKLSALGVATSKEEARKGTIASAILGAHNSGDDKTLRLTFDSLTSHDLTYVGIIQTARASGMDRFPMPYVLTNCHNSLCAVGGTINQDDHVFALSAAQKYGGVYVPASLAVIHSYNREMMAGCGKMILGSDSHTRYGALGTLAVGEGGGELAKQLVGRTYDMIAPEVVAVYLSGKLQPGVGPLDVALSIIKAVFDSGCVTNKVMEFVGDGIANLPMDYRNGIDVMTTETTCWSSIWVTDEVVKDRLENLGRARDYRPLHPANAAYYDGLVYVDLATIEPCIALPFHPSNVFTIRELKENPKDILAAAEIEGQKALGVSGLKLGFLDKCRDGGIWAEQGIIAGCAGGIFDNVMAAADVIKGGSIGNGNFALSVYPESQPTYLALLRNGACETFMSAGALVKEAFCGPCFGAGDIPANGELSLRHVTRNFPNREGSKPGEGQIASVALMDARSIAATAINGGKITSATELGISFGKHVFSFDKSVYEKRVYDGTNKPKPETALIFGPNIKDWTAMPKLPENILVKIISFITDPVTTTDELIPSGETASFRSNPLRLAEFTLSRKDPAYVGKAKLVQKLEEGRAEGNPSQKTQAELSDLLAKVRKLPGCSDIALADIGIGSAIYARKPGDGSAREQAASCQRVLGASANFALEYATKRYRSNLINWGIVPFVLADEKDIAPESFVFFPALGKALREKARAIKGYLVDSAHEVSVSVGNLSDEERQILLDGCLINHYRK